MPHLGFLRAPLSSRSWFPFEWRPQPTGDRGFGENNRDIRLDFGRCLAALAVIYLHCSDRYTSISDPASRYVSYIVYSYSLFCVPMFFMISGSLLIGKPIRSFSVFFKNRLLTILKPFVFGAAFYLIWQIAYQHTLPPSFSSYIHDLVLGVPYFHLWFLPSLFAIYLTLPIMQNLSPSHSHGVVGTTATLLALSGLNIYLSLIHFGIDLFSGPTGYLPLFLAGFCLYYLIDITKRTACLAAIFAPLITAACIAIASAEAGRRAGWTFQGFSSPTVVVQSVAMFSLLLRLKTPEFLVTMVRRFAPNTLGIYIVHFAVMTMLIDRLYAVTEPPAILVMLIAPPVTFLLSYILVKAIHLIPGMKGFV